MLSTEHESELTEMQQHCVKSIKLKTTTTLIDGEPKTTVESELKLWDKQAAHRDLGRMLGWGKDKEEDMPDSLKQLIQIGVIVLPPGKSVEEAIAGYLPYGPKILEADK